MNAPDSKLFTRLRVRRGAHEWRLSNKNPLCVTEGGPRNLTILKGLNEKKLGVTFQQGRDEVEAIVAYAHNAAVNYDALVAMLKDAVQILAHPDEPARGAAVAARAEAVLKKAGERP